MKKGKLLRVYDYVNQPYETVRAALTTDDVNAVFSKATQSAASRAHGVATELHVNIGGINIGTDISLSVKTVEDLPKDGVKPPHLKLELEWIASKMPNLFPFMQAELSVYPITKTETQLDFSGNYQPPLGALGKALDSVVGHRVAEASIYRFIRDVAAYLREELSA